MAWTNPPDVIVELRAMLVACASAVAAGLVQANVHYPFAIAESDDATSPDSMPRALVEESTHTRTRYAESGVAAIPGGTLGIRIDAELDIGQLEELGRDLASELASQSTGLPVQSVTVGNAVQESAARRAADATSGDTKAAYRSISLTIEWGLTA